MWLDNVSYSTIIPLSMYRDIKEAFQSMQTAPILFIGSGFSRRYCGTPSWRELLEKLARVIRPELSHPFQKYRNDIGRELNAEELFPLIAEQLEKDFNERYFNESDFSAGLDVNISTHLIENDVSPFRLYLSEMFRKVKKQELSPELDEELSDLSRAAQHSFNAIITTNYDSFLEERLKDFSVFTSQESLMSSPVTGFQEIYKIHGSCDKPTSLVFTASDYSKFVKYRAYTAAKILTLFVEQPIIFLGYSISDSNIRNILGAIAECMEYDKLPRFGKNLFFVDYSPKQEEPIVGTTTMEFEGRVLEATKITTSTYLPVFKELAKVHRNYDIGLLKKIRKDLYQTVTSNTAQEVIKVISAHEAFSSPVCKNIMAFESVGVGHLRPTPFEIYEQVLRKNHHFEIKTFIESFLKEETKGDEYPLFFYIRQYLEQGYSACELPPYAWDYIRNKSQLENFFNASLLEAREKSNLRTLKECFEYRKSRKHNGPKSLKSVCYCVAALPQHVLLSDETLSFVLEYLTLENFKGNTHLKRLVRIFDWHQNYSAVLQLLEERQS